MSTVARITVCVSRTDVGFMNLMYLSFTAILTVTITEVDIDHENVSRNVIEQHTWYALYSKTQVRLPAQHREQNRDKLSSLVGSNDVENSTGQNAPRIGQHG